MGGDHSLLLPVRGDHVALVGGNHVLLVGAPIGLGHQPVVQPENGLDDALQIGVQLDRSDPGTELTGLVDAVPQ
jgi:hypothetical protein